MVLSLHSLLSLLSLSLSLSFALSLSLSISLYSLSLSISIGSVPSEFWLSVLHYFHLCYLLCLSLDEFRLPSFPPSCSKRTMLEERLELAEPLEFLKCIVHHLVLGTLT